MKINKNDKQLRWIECIACKGYGYVKDPNRGFVDCKKCGGKGEIKSKNSD